MLIDAATRANLELTATLSGERRGQPARRHRPHGHRRRRAAARPAPRRARRPTPASIDRRLDAVALDARRHRPARRDPRRISRPPPTSPAPCRGSRLDRGGPRDLAAIRDGLDAAEADRSAELGSPATPLPDELAAAAGALARPPARSRRRRSPRRSPTTCRISSATAASSATAIDADLDEARKLRDESRRVIAGLQADYAAETDIRGLKITPQQRPRLFHRGRRQSWRAADGAAAQRPLHPPPDHGQRGALHHHRARRPRSEDRRRRRAGAGDRARGLRRARRGGRDRRGRRSARSPRRSRCSTSPPRSPCSPRRRTIAGRWSRTRWPSRSRAAAIRWSSRRSAATASPSSPTTARSVRRRPAMPAISGWSPGRTWPASRPSSARTR